MTTLDSAAVDGYDTVSVSCDEHVDGVVTAVVSRPSSQNAMSQQVKSELKKCLAVIEQSDARVVVITGDDATDSFVAGADVNDFRERDFETQRHASRTPRIYEQFADLPQPVIARINGHAIGGGCELATACDIRIAQEGAKIGQPEISLGLMPGGGATQRLPRLIGEGKAMEMMLTGELVTTEEAERIGLVNRTVAEEELDDVVYSMAESISRHSTMAIEYTKKACKAASSIPLDSGIEYERDLFNAVFAVGEKDEGIDAFLDGRKPEWKDR